MAEKNYLSVAIQKNGRLNNDTVFFLKNCGIDIAADAGLYNRKQSINIDIVYVRDDDIPELVANNICDVGIVGRNVFLERKIAFDTNVSEKIKKFEIIKYLGFGNCRLSLAIPSNIAFNNLTDLNGKKIATSYPYLLKQFLLKHNLTSEIVCLSGSVEIAPKLGLADLICDLVATGTTLLQNDLREVYCVLTSEAILFSSSNLSDEKLQILNFLLSKDQTNNKAKVCND